MLYTNKILDLFAVKMRYSTQNTQLRRLCLRLNRSILYRSVICTIGEAQNANGPTVERETIGRKSTVCLAASVFEGADELPSSRSLGRVIDQRSDPRDTPCNFLGASPLSNSSAMIKSHPSGDVFISRQTR